MGQVRHGSATTTHAVRAAIQRSQASLAQLSRELGINPKTVAKWRKRATVEDRKTGPTEPRSTVLTEAEEAMVVAFRRHTLLPLDDCLYALQPSIPHLTRSALHRCLQRHGISRLPVASGDQHVDEAPVVLDAGEVAAAAQDQRLFDGLLQVPVLEFHRAVLMGFPAVVAAGFHAVMADEGVVARGDIFALVDGQVAKGGREAVGAMLTRCPAERPERLLQVLGQSREALPAQDHTDMFPAAVDHDEVVKQGHSTACKVLSLSSNGRRSPSQKPSRGSVTVRRWTILRLDGSVGSASNRRAVRSLNPARAADVR